MPRKGKSEKAAKNEIKVLHSKKKTGCSNPKDTPAYTIAA
jgi:hypothetical protein